ncbi:MAG: hypothetical protein HY257_02835 [Chloroflexi bacterium]|nr:hypothetical protein [Chloroflexota bacterium]
MPRRLKPKQQKRDWRWYAQTALNGVVALSMVLGTLFLFTGAPSPQTLAPATTVEIPTLAPTAAIVPALVATPAPTSTVTPIVPLTSPTR